MRESALNICLGCAIAVGSPVLLAAGAPASADRPALVITAPWSDGATVVQAAGGTLLFSPEADLGTKAVFDADGLEIVRRQNGVWAVLDLARFAAICGQS